MNKREQSANTRSNREMEALPVLKGLYRDSLRERNGRAVDFGWKSNHIVTPCRTLIAAFFKGAGDRKSVV